MAPTRIDTPRPGVWRNLLSRPGARNAIDTSVRSALDEALWEADEAPHIRALILGGVGEFFCAGGDLPTMANRSPEAASCHMRELYAIVTRLWSFPKSVVIALEDAAVGAGAGLALLADYIVMGAEFAEGFVAFKEKRSPNYLTVN